MADTIAMMGPIFSINSDVKVDFSHSDLEEILNSKALKKGNIGFYQILTMIAKENDIEAIKTKDFDLEDLGMS